MTYLADITTSRDRLASVLATESLDPRPNYTVDGRTVSWDTYRNSLVQQIRDLNQMVINAGGAAEISSIALG